MTDIRDLGGDAVAQSTGIVLAATGISFANEWINTGVPNFRVPIAGIAFALIDAGIEELSPKAAIGLATIMLITVLVTPFGASKSPAATLAGLAVARPATNTLPVTQVVAN